MAQAIAPRIGPHSKKEDFKCLQQSRECKEQTGYWNCQSNKYVLLGWSKEGEPIFVDNGMGATVWDPSKATDNKGRRVCNVLYWRCDESSGGCGRLLPPNVRINPKNMWLEMLNCGY